MGKNVVIVGGGLSGLAASIYLARAGRTVTLFEKRRYLGGRAVTNRRHGFRFNLGAHAFYRFGAASRVCRELGIPVQGGIPRTEGIALWNGTELALPASWLSLLTTSLLTFRGKRQLAMALLRIRRWGGKRAGSQTVGEWLDSNLSDERARRVLVALLRLVTYSDRVVDAGAAPVLAQAKLAMRGVLYVHEGWQKIVDTLHNAAVTAGVNFVSSSRIVGVVQDGTRVRAIELGGLELDADLMDTQAIAYPEKTPDEVEGALIPADTAILAVDPLTAARLAGDAGAAWKDAQPVIASCLDVALRELPDPDRTFAIGIDEPLYYSVHSTVAQLAPKGGALIHLIKYGAAGSPADEQDLEALLDRMQPVWRERLVHRRFLPSMTVANALPSPTRPRPSTATAIRGLYLAGDWVGDEGMLSNAAFASARAAAKAVLAED